MCITKCNLYENNLLILLRLRFFILCDKVNTIHKTCIKNRCIPCVSTLTDDLNWSAWCVLNSFRHSRNKGVCVYVIHDGGFGR